MLLLLMTIAQLEPDTSDAGTDLARLTQTGCETETEKQPDEIIVCAEQPKDYRIEPLASPPPALPDASIRFSDQAIATARIVQEGINGWPSNRAMLTIKIGF